MLIDLHAHSHLSKGCDLDPRAVLERAASLGLEGVAFTETNTQDGCDELFDLRPKSPAEVFVGLELGTDRGSTSASSLKPEDGARAGAALGEQPGEALERGRVPPQGEVARRRDRRGPPL